MLASVFLPLTTIAAVFGMNMHHGFENFPPWVFWIVLFVGMFIGLLISSFVLGFRSRNLQKLIDLEAEAGA